MNRYEATIFRGGAIIRTECALIALSEGPCGKLVGCSAAAANNRGIPCADYIGYPSAETIAGHFSENDHRQFRLIRSVPFLLISPQADRSLAPGRCLFPGWDSIPNTGNRLAANLLLSWAYDRR